MGNLIKILLQISSRLRRWKNLENWPVFDEVMPKILLVRFFSGHGVYTKRRYVCLSVCGLPMAGRTAGPIKVKLGIGTYVDPGSVLVKVKVKVVYLCMLYKEFMTATPGEQQ